jgi:hypothetical protein
MIGGTAKTNIQKGHAKEGNNPIGHAPANAHSTSKIHHTKMNSQMSIASSK